MARYDILLISDGTNLLQTIGWVLEYKGFAVKTTTSPEAALEALVRKNYDLVIAKLTTDDLEGLDILKRAKRLNPEVKVMVGRGNHDAIFPLEAYEIEVDDYLLMPLSPPELWRRVSRCLEGREVVDLQPVRVAASPEEGDQGGPQMMLMLHDIRGAMISSAASLKLLARGFYGEMNEKAKAKLHEVTDRIETMSQLSGECIGGPWVYHRPESRGRDVVDLTVDVVEPVLAELDTTIQAHQITLVNRLGNQAEGKIAVRGKKSWLKGVFRNLITNGITHGGRGCTIVVDLERDASRCRLHVYNPGKTVPAAYQPMLCSYGQGICRSKKNRQGLGLGLSLSRDVIQNQGSDIW
jgi:DNA-binding NarL/FixJ family response regulator